jgi:hypothetical protein
MMSESDHAGEQDRVYRYDGKWDARRRYIARCRWQQVFAQYPGGERGVDQHGE